MARWRKRPPRRRYSIQNRRLGGGQTDRIAGAAEVRRGQVNGGCRAEAFGHANTCANSDWNSIIQRFAAPAYAPGVVGLNFWHQLQFRGETCRKFLPVISLHREGTLPG